MRSVCRGLRWGACSLAILPCATPAAAQADGAAACPAQAASAGAVERPHAASTLVAIRVGIELSCALTTALEPWGIRVVASNAGPPGSSMPSTSPAAHRIAIEHSARAVVWLGRDASGFALWVYDAQAGRSIARPIPDPPFDASVAAALALSVKTSVRIAGLAPAAEEELERPPSAEPPLDARVPSLWLLPYGGARFGPTEAVGARWGAELRWLPWAKQRGAGAWLGLALEAGPPTSPDDSRFEGRLWDPAVQLGLGWSHSLGETLGADAGLALAVHRASLTGTLLDSGETTDVTRLNPALLARLGLQLQVLGVTLVLEPALGLWLRRQRFLVDGEPVVGVEPVSLRLTLGLLLPLQ